MHKAKAIQFFNRFPQAPGRLSVLWAGFPMTATLLRFAASILLLAIVLGTVEYHAEGRLELAMATFAVAAMMGMLYLGFFSALVAVYGLMEIKGKDYAEATRLAGEHAELKRYFNSAQKLRGKLLNQELLMARDLGFKKAGIPETNHKVVFTRHCETAGPHP